MKTIPRKINSFDYDGIIGSKINKFLVDLDSSKKNDNQKILELCQIGKLIGFFFPDYNIIETRERPDFLISNEIETIGIEHTRILDKDIKAKEGFYENICLKIKEKLEKDLTIPNFLVNLLLKRDINFENRNKQNITEQLTRIILDYINNDEFKENPLVHSIMKMPHSRKSINANFGAYMVNPITEQLILNSIKNKESKIKDYKNFTNSKQWLVLVIGNITESSFELTKLYNLDLKTSFDKVYLFEDFSNNLYELK